MKKCVDGEYIEMTEAEIAELVTTEAVLPTAEERIAALEAAVLELIMGGGSGD